MDISHNEPTWKIDIFFSFLGKISLKTCVSSLTIWGQAKLPQRNFWLEELGYPPHRWYVGTMVQGFTIPRVASVNLMLSASEDGRMSHFSFISASWFARLGYICTRSPPLFFPVCWGAREGLDFSSVVSKAPEGFTFTKRDSLRFLQWQHEINFYKTNKLGKNEEGCSREMTYRSLPGLKVLSESSKKDCITARMVIMSGSIYYVWMPLKLII